MCTPYKQHIKTSLLYVSCSSIPKHSGPITSAIHLHISSALPTLRLYLSLVRWAQPIPPSFTSSLPISLCRIEHHEHIMDSQPATRATNTTHCLMHEKKKGLRDDTHNNPENCTLLRECVYAHLFISPFSLTSRKKRIESTTSISYDIYPLEVITWRSVRWPL